MFSFFVSQGLTLSLSNRLALGRPRFEFWFCLVRCDCWQSHSVSVKLYLNMQTHFYTYVTVSRTRKNMKTLSH